MIGAPPAPGPPPGLSGMSDSIDPTTSALNESIKARLAGLVILFQEMMDLTDPVCMTLLEQLAADPTLDEACSRLKMCLPDAPDEKIAECRAEMAPLYPAPVRRLHVTLAPAKPTPAAAVPVAATTAPAAAAAAAPATAAAATKAGNFNSKVTAFLKSGIMVETYIDSHSAKPATPDAKWPQVVKAKPNVPPGVYTLAELVQRLGVTGFMASGALSAIMSADAKKAFMALPEVSGYVSKSPKRRAAAAPVAAPAGEAATPAPKTMAASLTSVLPTLLAKANEKSSSEIEIEVRCALSKITGAKDGGAAVIAAMTAAGRDIPVGVYRLQGPGSLKEILAHYNSNVMVMGGLIARLIGENQPLHDRLISLVYPTHQITVSPKKAAATTTTTTSSAAPAAKTEYIQFTEALRKIPREYELTFADKATGAVAVNWDKKVHEGQTYEQILGTMMGKTVTYGDFLDKMIWAPYNSSILWNVVNEESKKAVRGYKA